MAKNYRREPNRNLELKNITHTIRRQWMNIKEISRLDWGKIYILVPTFHHNDESICGRNLGKMCIEKYLDLFSVYPNE